MSGFGADSVAFSPNGRTLASGNDDGTIRLWDVSSPARPRLLGQPLTSGTRGTPVYSVAFDPDGRTLASGTSGGTIPLWNLNVGYAIERICTTAGTLRSQAMAQLRLAATLPITLHALSDTVTKTW